MILYAHGLGGSPNGNKVRALREAGLRVAAPDAGRLPLFARIRQLDECTEKLCQQHGPIVLAGSSYGGLAAAYLAQRHPQRLGGLLLLAPALHVHESPVEDSSAVEDPANLKPPPNVPVVILHGMHDRTVPLEASRRYAKGSHAVLYELNDGHRLEGSLDRVVAEARKLVEGIQGISSPP